MTAPDFRRRFFADRADLCGARWWHEEMARQSLATPAGTDRRALLTVVGGGLAMFLVGPLVRCYRDYDDKPEVSMDALELQRGRGWDVGAGGQALSYPSPSAVDAVGAAGWASGLETLLGELAPAQGGLGPFYVPTLFQMLANDRFRRTVTPMHTDDMDTAFARGNALADLFDDLPDVGSTALVIDAPGPEAVAVAAGVAERFEPVFLFDNWPHPHGVVASHHVIAAAIYYRPLLNAARAKRSWVTPPAFVLDDRRLAPYRDESGAFDNRYLARLPSAAAFGQLNVRHVLYVTSTPVAHEADDLNDDFTALVLAGIDVKMLALSDFRFHALSNTYSYGGSTAPRLYFWRSYGWYHLPGPPADARPPVVFSDGARYQPTPRNTIFSSRTVGGLGGVGKQKPSGFGRVSVRTSGTGSVTVGRSGSFGRTRFGGGG